MKYTKPTLFIIAALLFSLSIFAQQQVAKPSTAAPATVKLLTTADTLQYSLGAFIGQWMLKNSFTVSNQTLFKRGLDDVLQNKKLAVTDTIIAPIISAYQMATQNARSRLMEDQLFAALKGKPGVGALPSGVHYIVVKAGTGMRPTVADSIEINAMGVFPDGTVFEDTFKRKQTIKTMPSSLIPGLNESLQLMPEGSVWRIFIPSALAYGPSGLSNIIPPNTALVFDITLLKVKSKK